VSGNLVEASSGWVELERPQELVGLLEARSNGVDLVNQIFNADDSVLAQLALDDSVVSDSNALLVDLSKASLVDKLLHGLLVGVTIGDVGLHELQHLKSSFVEANKHSVVDLSKSQQLQNLPGLGMYLIDTSNADDQGQPSVRLDEEVARGFRLAAEAHQLTFLRSVLLNVLLRSLENNSSGGYVFLSQGSSLLLLVSLHLLGSASLLEDRLRNSGSLLCWRGSL